MDALIFQSQSLLYRPEFTIKTGHQPQNGLISLISGSFSCRFSGEETFIANSGDFIFFPMAYRFERFVLKPCHLYLTYFTVNEEHPLADFLPHGLIRFQNINRVNENLSCLVKYAERSDQITDYMRQHALNDIFYQYCLENLQHESNRTYSAQVESVIQFFAEYYEQKITLKDAAEAAALSPNGLIARFQKETGCSPMQYLTDLRINAAKKALSNTDLPISSIAEKAGYDNIYYFSNAFKKRCGCSPSEDRRKSPTV